MKFIFICLIIFAVITIGMALPQHIMETFKAYLKEELNFKFK